MSKEELSLRFEALSIAARYTCDYILRGFESSGASEENVEKVYKINVAIELFQK